MIAKKKYPKDILEQLADYRTCVYAAFKGTSDENIRENTQANLTVDNQIYAFGKLVDAGLKVFPCVYNPDWKTLPEFLDRLDRNFVHASKLLRVEPLDWKYGPTRNRIKCMAQEGGIPPEQLLSKYISGEEENFNVSEKIMYFYLKKMGLPYKQFDRTKYSISRKRPFSQKYA
ncbi:MAG: hypothetical protein V1839_00695 [archaeon]